MSVGEELGRLARLYREGMLSHEEFERAKAGLLASPAWAGASRGVFAFQGIRRRSEVELFGLPLWSVALGPDWQRGERRGHARGFFAVGDLATGVFALGGMARGVVALGGLSLGLLTVGGGSFGLLFAFGGFALGGIAVGGLAVGAVAVGGLAVGYYAAGGGAVGAHTLSAVTRDPEAVEFFRRFLPWVPGLPRS